MKIIVDENIPLMTVETPRKLGHDVLDIRGTPDEESPDDDLWSKSQREKRLLVTTEFKRYGDQSIRAMWTTCGSN